MKVEGSHGAIQGGGDDDVARGGERHSSDPTGVLREGDKAKATEGVPHLDLGVWGWGDTAAVNTATQTQTMQCHTGLASIPGEA